MLPASQESHVQAAAFSRTTFDGQTAKQQVCLAHGWQCILAGMHVMLWKARLSCLHVSMSVLQPDTQCGLHPRPPGQRDKHTAQGRNAHPKAVQKSCPAAKPVRQVYCP